MDLFFSVLLNCAKLLQLGLVSELGISGRDTLSWFVPCICDDLFCSILLSPWAIWHTPGATEDTSAISVMITVLMCHKSPASTERTQHPWESGLNIAIGQICSWSNHWTKKLVQAYIWPYLSAVLSKALYPVWWRLVATCHQQLTSMTLCPETGWVRLSRHNSAPLSPFSHHLP